MQVRPRGRRKFPLLRQGLDDYHNTRWEAAGSTLAAADTRHRDLVEARRVLAGMELESRSTD